MIAFLAGAIPFVKNNYKLILGAVAALAISFAAIKVLNFVNEKAELENQVFQQQVQLDAAAAREEALKTELQLAEEATAIAEDVLDYERAKAISAEAARQRALAVPDEDNGPLAPVFLDALDDIRGPADAP